MQTFLPYPDFLESAKCLDKKRCFNQVKEAKQILTLLEHRKNDRWYILDIKRLKKEGLYEKFKHLPTYRKSRAYYYRLIGHIKHPAVDMWEGHPIALKEYFNSFLWVCKYVHKINTAQKMEEVYEGTSVYPWWLGNKDFHRAMRARLIEKDNGFYLPKFPLDKGFNGGKYLWPVMETKTFKII